MDHLFHGPPFTPPLCFVQPADQPRQKADRVFFEENEDSLSPEKGKLDAWGKEPQSASMSPILQRNFTALEEELDGHITEVEEQEELIRQCKVRSQ